MPSPNRLDATPLPLNLDKLPAHMRPFPVGAPAFPKSPMIGAEPAEAGKSYTAWGDYIAQYEGKEL